MNGRATIGKLARKTACGGAVLPPNRGERNLIRGPSHRTRKRRRGRFTHIAAEIAKAISRATDFGRHSDR